MSTLRPPPDEAWLDDLIRSRLVKHVAQSVSRRLEMRKLLEGAYKELGATEKQAKRAVRELSEQEMHPARPFRQSNGKQYGLSAEMLAMVTTLITKKDAQYDSKEMAAAISKEMETLTSNATWDRRPIAKAVAFLQLPSAKVVSLHMLRGVKHSEDASARRCKARGVALGNQLRDVDGEAAFMDNEAAIPAAVSDLRTTMAYGLSLSSTPHMKTLVTSDAEGAYLQAPLEEDVVVLLRIPREFWTADMQQQAAGVREALWRLRKGLYGMAVSGRNWMDFLQRQLATLGWHRRATCRP